jgi:hypothetical protein
MCYYTHQVRVWNFVVYGLPPLFLPLPDAIHSFQNKSQSESASSLRSELTDAKSFRINTYKNCKNGASNYL